jgi:hypothetical protein
MIDIHKFTAQPKRQDSVEEQLSDLISIANRLGMHDAADAIQQIHSNLPILRYGCHCDLEPGQNPDGCVIDDGLPMNCIYAKTGMRKEQCLYWRIVKGAVA